MSALRIEQLRVATQADVAGLSDLLLDAVDDNAGISFMKGLTRPTASTSWAQTPSRAGSPPG